ncbi:MAG TPA: class I SAM-dependent methyltransferase [Pirellulaceae bacterium]|nr:class I SAM-dependent methyltransferase [Pirellulaceae bacterium]HMO92954.1 class I SAM-dependent methyltransferase [Pirellulaceae bacterium]HMP68481.1 class I SAM-dependent methyltransferase [Pirellulaceae bacterium]
MKLRQAVVPNCVGQVLEVGSGSGLNFSLYDKDQVDKVWALEPSFGMRRRAMKLERMADAPSIEWLDSTCEQLPLADESVDTILLTYTLCSIGKCDVALGQMLRVLKPRGRLLFCEHGLAPDRGTRRLQRLMNPLWRKLAGGCHLTRQIDALIEGGGFEIQTLERAYTKQLPRFVGYCYWGAATKDQAL